MYRCNLVSEKQCTASMSNFNFYGMLWAENVVHPSSHGSAARVDEATCEPFEDLPEQLTIHERAPVVFVLRLHDLGNTRVR